MSKKQSKNSNKTTNSSYYGQLLEQLSELTSLLREFNQRLQDFEVQILETERLYESSEMTLPIEEEYLESFLIQLNEELYQELCRVLGQDKMRFMAIA